MPKPDINRIYAGKFTAFADCLIVGFLVLLASVPLVTAFVAITAGTALLRDRAVRDATVDLRGYCRRFSAVARTGWQGFVVPSVVGSILLTDYVALRAGLGHDALVTAAVGLIALVTCVFLLRSAAAWQPGRPWRTAAGTAARHMTGELPGSAVLGAAVLPAVLLTGWIPAVGAVVLGPLCLAAAALEDGSPHAPVTAGRPAAL